MRKAEKRRLGEARAKQAEQESRESGLREQAKARKNLEEARQKRAAEAKKESDRLEAILAIAGAIEDAPGEAGEGCAS